MVGEERIPMPERRHNFITWLDNSDAAYWSDHLNAETGMRVFEFKPTEWMKWKHQIQEHDYNQDTGRIIREFPDDVCYNASTSANSIRWFILCDYNKKDTGIMDRINKELIIKLDALRAENKSLRIALKVTQKESIKREAHRKEAQAELFEQMKAVKKLVDTGYQTQDG